MTGVYKIICQANGREYIGVSKNINNRWNAHKRQLKRQIHHSILMQKDYNTFGEDRFKFEIVKECSLSEAKKIEEELIQTCKPFYNRESINMSAQEVTVNRWRLLKKTMISQASKYVSPTFWRGKKVLLFDINTFSQKTALNISDILLRIGVNKIGVNASLDLTDEGIYIGTLTTNDTLYLTLACKDDGSNYKESVVYVM